MKKKLIAMALAASMVASLSAWRLQAGRSTGRD